MVYTFREGYVEIGNVERRGASEKSFDLSCDAFFDKNIY
jgi:hypothetical protein